MTSQEKKICARGWDWKPWKLMRQKIERFIKKDHEVYESKDDDIPVPRMYEDENRV